jgi:hypothetical protein
MNEGASHHHSHVQPLVNAAVSIVLANNLPRKFWNVLQGAPFRPVPVDLDVVSDVVIVYTVLSKLDALWAHLRAPSNVRYPQLGCTHGFLIRTLTFVTAVDLACT